MPFIKLTHMVGSARRNVYVNSDQIVRISEPIGPSAGYQASLLLANGSQDVLESVAQVMALIQGAKDGAAVG
jgi:S-ribosylhomocysteine lyase LuxS involved in autoinducer biosynthesis